MRGQEKVRGGGSKLWKGWAFAIATRVLASITESHWFDRNDWCQTLEPANLIAHGFGIHSPETGLHIRNLSWPVLLSGALKGSEWLAPHSVDFRIFAVNLLAGILDLLILWGWIQMLNHREEGMAPFSDRAKRWSLVLLLVPWFTIYGAVSPRYEHLSEIATWAALGCLAGGYWVAAGFSSVAIFAARYPSALLSLGLVVGLAISCVKKKEFSPLLRFGMGCIGGAILFGIPDAIYYGRPWESFWMYLQYNLFTATGTQVFGTQPFSVYSELFLWNWTTYPIFIPIGVALLGASFYGLWNGIKRSQAWATALTLYLIPHLFIGHKEARFMVPAETLLRWAAFSGGFLLLQNNLHSGVQYLGVQSKAWRGLRRFALGFVGVALLWNGVAFLHHLRGDFWKVRGVYREVGRHLKNVPDVCGILVPFEISSVLLPEENSSFPGPPPVGIYSGHFEEGTDPRFQGGALRWMERSGQCSAAGQLLVLVRRAEQRWSREGCEILPSGVFGILSGDWRKWALRGGISGSAWYRCSNQFLGRFQKQETEFVTSHSFGRFDQLPPYGLSAEELEQLGIRTSPPPVNAPFPKLSDPSRTRGALELQNPD